MFKTSVPCAEIFYIAIRLVNYSTWSLIGGDTWRESQLRPVSQRTDIDFNLTVSDNKVYLLHRDLAVPCTIGLVNN